MQSNQEIIKSRPAWFSPAIIYSKENRRRGKKKHFSVSASLGCESIQASLPPVPRLWAYISLGRKSPWDGLTVTLEFHILEGRGEQMGNLSFIHIASLREYSKHPCLLSNFRNCIWVTSTYEVFPEPPLPASPQFVTYHLFHIFKTSNFLFPSLSGPCFPDTQVWIDRGLPLGNSCGAFFWA